MSIRVAHLQAAAVLRATVERACRVELDAMGVPPGPERLARVFAETSMIIKGGAPAGRQTPGYSASTASALSNSGGSRSGASAGASSGNGEARITPTKAEEAVAAKLEKQGIMKKSDYFRSIAEQNPQRVER